MTEMKAFIYYFFAVRESVQESLGFSAFELVFGHSVHDRVKPIKEKFLDDDEN